MIKCKRKELYFFSLIFLVSLSLFWFQKVPINDFVTGQDISSFDSGVINENNKAKRPHHHHEPPIVIEQHKLIFFTTPKIANTVFKQLMRRMMGYNDWKQETTHLPHNPQHNGLKYLSQYTNEDIASMLSNNSGWTKAIFVRDPKERVLSAYVEFVVRKNATKFRDACCKSHGSCSIPGSFQQFVQSSILDCPNPHWMYLTSHLEERYWENMDFVGSLDTVAEDTRTLLTKVGVWDRYGKSGWGNGDDDDASIFERSSKERYQKQIKKRLVKRYSPQIEMFVDLLFNPDYDNKRLGLKRTEISTGNKDEGDDDYDVLSSTNQLAERKYKLARVFGVESIDYSKIGAEYIDPQMDKPVTELSRDHYIYRWGTWDGSPVVVTEYKLLFFTTPKVACTVFKQLFRRIKGYEDWRVGDETMTHDPHRNGLEYLHQFPEKKALEMMTSKEWTRAIFVREPKERVLSAYLDKAVKKGGLFVRMKCCPVNGICQERTNSSFKGFLQVISQCQNPHWQPQTYRMEGRYWKYINFVGHVETAEADAKRLLQKIGAWEKYGASGWGKSGDEAIFASKGSVGHSTLAANHLREYYDAETDAIVNEMYRLDFENPLFNFTRWNVSA